MNVSDNIVSEVRESRLKKNLGFFEGNLIWWVMICIVTGIVTGYFAGDKLGSVAELNYGPLNIPVVLLVWLMIFPRMVQVDFSAIKRAGNMPGGISLTVVVNWLVKPFTMAVLAWIFFEHVFSAFLSAEQVNQYIAGAILLGAAPCTAMVFIWSYLTNGSPLYTLIQVGVNDFILLIIYVPVAGFLLGVSGIGVPFTGLVLSVLVFIALPLAAGFLVNMAARKLKGEVWFRTVFLKKLKSVSVLALLATLVLLFSFQGNNIIENPLHVVIISVPLIILSFSMFFISWLCGTAMSLPDTIKGPAAILGASNFIEFSVAAAIVLFGLSSGAALAVATGVLVEVPVMLSLVRMANRLVKG